MGFRQENKYLIYCVNAFGLYMYSIETLVSNKCILGFLSVWTKLPIILLGVVVSLDSRAMLFDQMDILKRLALIRKVIGTFSFFFKNVFFYRDRRRFERLIDLWDDSFKENLFNEKNLMMKEENRKQNKKTVTALGVLGFTAVAIYCIPSYFSKTKEIKHPTGLIYPHHSPGFEVAVTFDLFVSILSLSAVFFDGIMCVLVSIVRSKLVFLRETLADIINEIIIDDKGRLLGRRIRRHADASDVYEERQPNSEEFKKNLEIMDNKLRIWILHHQQIIGFFDHMSKIYSSIATFELSYNVFYTAMTALNVVKMKLSFIAFGVLLVASSNLLSLFLWCKLSGELKEIGMFDDGFSRAWFLLPKKMTTAFSFIIMRSKKPLSLYGFSLYPMNLATFFEILKLAYQSFAFMVQMSDDNS